MLLPLAWFPPKEVIYALEDDMSKWKTIEILILIELNNYRIENNLKPLIPEVHSKVESDVRTTYMAEVMHASHDYFPLSDVKLKDMGFKSVAENVGSGHTTAEKAMHAWKHSPEHNLAMLNSRYEYVGISMSANGKHTYFCMMLTR